MKIAIGYKAKVDKIRGLRYIADMRNDALALAIDFAGGLGALAAKLKITKQAITNWKTAPPRRVLAIENATKDNRGIPRVTRFDLRPDIYGPRPKGTRRLPPRASSNTSKKRSTDGTRQIDGETGNGGKGGEAEASGEKSAA